MEHRVFARSSCEEYAKLTSVYGTQGALVESRDTHRSYASSLLAEASGSVGAGKEPKNSTPHFVGSIRDRSIDSLALPLVRQVNCFAKLIAKQVGVAKLSKSSSQHKFAVSLIKNQTFAGTPSIYIYLYIFSIYCHCAAL